MLTGRGWWLILLASVLTFAGMMLSARGGTGMAYLGILVLTWLAFEWARFLLQREACLPRLRIQRECLAGGRQVRNLFPGQETLVRIRIANPSRFSLYVSHWKDLPPANALPVSGEPAAWLVLPARGEAVLEYTIRPASVGSIIFPGTSVRIADPQGFFVHRKVFRESVVLNVLPNGIATVRQSRVTKRVNALPTAGVQRFLRPGGAGDLLDLREYQPGDPPKMIAWKQTARRGDLVTKELESEVPVRCTLILDGGSTDPAVAQFARVAAGVAESALRNRDYVGLAVCRADGFEYLSPKRTSRHRVELLQTLAGAANPRCASTDLDWLRSQCFATANEIYPDLMDHRVNRVPFGVFWEPVLDSHFAWLILALLFSPLLFLVSDFRDLLEDASEAAGVTDFVGFAFLVAVGMLAVGLLGWLALGTLGHWPWRKSRLLQRKKLATLFAFLDGDRPAAIARYREDDALFSQRCRRFVDENSLAAMESARAEDPSLPARDGASLPHLTRALLRGVGKARDNELFVVMGDFVETEGVSVLWNALRVASGRRHQVIVVCRRLPMPDLAGLEPKASVLFDRLRANYQRRVERLRLLLGKQGVSVLWAEADDTVVRIVQRVSDLRVAGVRR